LAAVLQIRQSSVLALQTILFTVRAVLTTARLVVESRGFSGLH